MPEDLPRPMPPMREDNGMPGGRAALPKGRLAQPHFGAQGDEHRESAAPSPVKPAPTVDTEHADTKPR